MRLVFIRHGQTTGDVEGRYGGAYDDVLSPLGEQQVQQLADELGSYGFEKVFSSSLKRAKQTAEVLAQRTGCTLVTLEGLRERNQYGPLTGLTAKDARQQYPDLVEKVKDRLNTLPGAESYAEASHRVGSAYADVLAHTKNCAAVVWHGGCMRVLFRDILKLGELAAIGDCAWVEMERVELDGPFIVKQAKRIVF